MEMPLKTPGDEVRAVADALMEQPAANDVRAHVDEAIEALVRQSESTDDPAHAAIARASVVLLAAARVSMQSIGECQIDEPHADVYVVLTSEGLRYCCTHNPQHCRAL
jgi:hypothetical protein